MRSTNLPQPVAVRLLDLDERVTELMRDAEQAERVLENARDIINFKREDVMKAEYAMVRERFDGTYAHAQQARQRADGEQAILNGIRTWIADLPHNTKLCMVPPPNGGDDLAVLQARLQALRQELAKLNSITVPADDIAAKVQAYVQVLAENASATVARAGCRPAIGRAMAGRPSATPTTAAATAISTATR